MGDDDFFEKKPNGKKQSELTMFGMNDISD